MPRWSHRIAFVLTLTIAAAAFVGTASPKVLIFVGPQTRDGFVDFDSGVLDSIKDIKDELRGTRDFIVVEEEADATISLIVVGRRTPGQSGSVGVPIGSMAMFLPIHRRAIDTILKVGAYEKAITSEDENNDTWRAAARRVRKDVTAWLDANRAVLKQ